MLRTKTLGLYSAVRLFTRSSEWPIMRPLITELAKLGYDVRCQVFYVPPLDQCGHAMTQLYGPVSVQDIVELRATEAHPTLRLVAFNDEDFDLAYTAVEVVEDGEARYLGYLVTPSHRRDFIVALENFPEVADTVVPKPRNFMQLKAALADMGMTCRKRDGEYRVTFLRIGVQRAEEVAAYCTDVRDAWGTANAMYDTRARNHGRV